MTSSAFPPAVFPPGHPCPCGTSMSYQDCCGPFHTKAATAPTPEALMRSRYSAFVTGQISYLRYTLHPDHRHDFDEKHTRQWSETSQWQGLSVRSCVQETPDEGYVEFVARFQTEAGEACLHHETGRFIKDHGTWYYADGISGPRPIRSEPKAGRNDPCPCGSGKKFKKCCAAAA